MITELASIRTSIQIQDLKNMKKAKQYKHFGTCESRLSCPHSDTLCFVKIGHLNYKFT